MKAPSTLTVQQTMKECGVRSRMTLRAWKRRGKLRPIPGTGGHGKAAMYAAADVARVKAMKTARPGLGGLGIKKTHSPLFRPVAYDAAEFLARVAWGFDLNRRGVWHAVYGAPDNLVNADTILSGQLAFDDKPPQPGKVINNTLPPLDSVPLNVQKWARKCADVLNAAELRYLTAIFPASWYPFYGLRRSMKTLKAWHEFTQGIGKMALPKCPRVVNKQKIQKMNDALASAHFPLSFVAGDGSQSRVRFGSAAYYSAAEDEVRRIYKTRLRLQNKPNPSAESGAALGVGRARRNIAKLLEVPPDKFWIENPLAVSAATKQKSATQKKQGKLPSASTVARVLGISRMHACRLQKTAFRKLRSADAHNRLLEFFGGIYIHKQRERPRTAQAASVSAWDEMLQAAARQPLPRSGKLNNL